MKQFTACGMGGIVGVWLLGCGGTIDLHEGQAGAGGTDATAGVAGFGAVAGTSVGGSAGHGTTPVAGAAGDRDPGDPSPREGGLGYDLDADGTGRAIYLRAFAEPGCTRRLTDPSAQAKQAAFSADGTTMAYAAMAGGKYQIHLMTLASGDVETVTEIETGATSPAFSPDGSRLAYVTGDPEQFANRAPGAGDLVLLDLDTREERTLLDGDELGCCTQQALSPAFVNDQEMVVGTGMAMLAVNIDTLVARDLVPFNGRIPNPRDPAPGPDGIRYAFTDYCSGQSLFIGRLDGSTGDTCVSAKALATPPVVSADWGQYGYIAAASEGEIVLVDDRNFEVFSLSDTAGARNPAWFPSGHEPACE